MGHKNSKSNLKEGYNLKNIYNENEETETENIKSDLKINLG